MSAQDPRFRTVDVEWSDCLRSVDARAREYPEPEQFVEGFLTVGLTVVSATPKAGKTWLVHECIIGTATGDNALGTLPCRRSEVLCCFLEDSERRGILRERMLMGHVLGCVGITYAWVGSKWTLERVGRWLDLHPAAGRKRMLLGNKRCQASTIQRGSAIRPDRLVHSSFDPTEADLPDIPECGADPAHCKGGHWGAGGYWHFAPVVRPEGRKPAIADADDSLPF